MGKAKRQEAGRREKAGQAYPASLVTVFPGKRSQEVRFTSGAGKAGAPERAVRPLHGTPLHPPAASLQT